MQQDKALPKDLSGHIEVTALPNVYSVVAAANLPALQAALQFSDVWRETAILQRLFYKNKNQHRASKHHQAIGQVLRALKLLDQLQLPHLLTELHTAAQRTSVPEATTAAAAPHRNSKRRQQQPPFVDQATDGLAPSSNRQIVRLPSFQAGCFILRRLLASCQIGLKCNNAILTAAEHLSGQLSRGYFMPFCLVAVASLARLRVLLMDALMQQMQAYNSIMQLLPLLPVQANTTPQPTAAAAAVVSSHATGTAHQPPGLAINFSSSSSSEQYLGVDIHDLPDILKMTWHGVIPSLQCVPFDGGDEIASRAAHLQETFCISWPSGAGASVGDLVAAPTAEQRGSSILAAAAGSKEGEVGQSIGREEFERLLQQRQQHVSQALVNEDHHAGVNTVLPDSDPVQQRQQQQQQMPQILVFEDRHAAQSGAGFDSIMQDPHTVQQQQQQQQQSRVPMYSTAQALGTGLGLGLGQQQQQQQVLPPGLEPQQSPSAAAAAAGAAAASTVPMDNSSLRPEDQLEYEDLYGSDVPRQDNTTTAAAAVAPPAPTGGLAAAAAAGAHAVLLEQQRQQQQTRRTGTVAVKHQRLGTCAAAALAMQGYGSSSDDEMDDAATVPVPINAGTHAAAAVAAASSAPQGGVAQELLLQQQQQLGVSQHDPQPALVMQQTPQTPPTVELQTVAGTVATSAISAAAVNAAVNPAAATVAAVDSDLAAAADRNLAAAGSNPAAPAAAHGVESPAMHQQQQQQQQIQQRQTQEMMDVDDATAEAAPTPAAAVQIDNVTPLPAAAAAALAAEAQATQLLGNQAAAAAAAGCVTRLKVSRRAAKREAARQQQQQQQQSQPDPQDWVLQRLTTDPAAAVAGATAAAMWPTGAAGSHLAAVAGAAAASGARPAAAATQGGKASAMRHSRKTGAIQQGDQSTRGGSAGGGDRSGGESTNARDPILDMLLQGL